ncbi:MAG: ankyrin repeat domain-containing protein [Terracidiphilus sp.]|jgi:ankyrin repeat protein
MKALSNLYEFSVSRISRHALVMATALACTTLAFAGPIHDAARKGDLKKVQALIQADPSSVNSKDSMGDTPLHLAALHGELAVAQALVAAGADVNVKNLAGPFTPGDLWDVISGQNHPDPVRLLTVHGIIQSDMKNGYTPLDMASFSVRYMPMVKFLIEKGADVNAQASSGATPLFWAVMRQQKDELQYLIDHGANVNAADAYGDTIMDMVLHMQYTSMIQILLDHNVDLNAVDQSQHRALFYAMQMDDHRWADVLKKHGAHD